MPTQNIEIGGQTPIAAAGALKKAGYNVTSGGKPVQVSETDNTEQELNGTKEVDPKVGDVYKNIPVPQQGGKTVNRNGKVVSVYPETREVIFRSDAGGTSSLSYDVFKGQPNEIYEGDTMLDLFPELNTTKPNEGGEVKDIKTPKSNLEKTKLPKEVTPKKVKRDEKMENKNSLKNNVIENIMTKKEFMEVVRSGGQPGTAPSKPAPETPTIAPTKPGQKPDRQNPFKPKHKPKPKGQVETVPQTQQSVLPNWISAQSLGIGKQGINEARKMVEDTLNKSGIGGGDPDKLENPGTDLIGKMKTLRGATIRLLHLQDIFAKSDNPEQEIDNILRIIKHYKNRV